MDRPDNAALRSEMRHLLESADRRAPGRLPHRSSCCAPSRNSRSRKPRRVSAFPKSTVRTRFFRARSLLRESLAQDVDRAYVDAFGFAGERCDRIVTNVLARLAGESGPRG